MVLLRYLRHHLKPEIYGPGYAGLIKQAFTETPIYLFSISLFVLTAALIPTQIIKWNKIEGNKRRFMNHYTIMRPNDPNKHRFFYLDVNDKNNIIDNARKTYYDL